MNLDVSVLIALGVGGAAVYLMRRIAVKIEHRLDQVEDHEKRIAVVEERCKIFHNEDQA